MVQEAAAKEKMKPACQVVEMVQEGAAARAKVVNPLATLKGVTVTV